MYIDFSFQFELAAMNEKGGSVAESAEMRVLGLEPKTYGLKGRCSTN